MTPKIIELKQAPVVLVEFPEGSNFVRINSENGNVAYDDDEGIVICSLKIKHVQVVGILPNLTEEQFAECVRQSIHTGLFAHYVEGIIPPNAYCYSKASGSFYSLLESEKVYVGENPFGDYPCESGYNAKLKKSCIESCQGSCWDCTDFDHDEWQEAESRTIDPKRTVVLIRKEEQ